jgi:hypothetical protein
MRVVALNFRKEGSPGSGVKVAWRYCTILRVAQHHSALRAESNLNALRSTSTKTASAKVQCRLIHYSPHDEVVLSHVDNTLARFRVHRRGVGCAETVRKWVGQAQIDVGARVGVRVRSRLRCGVCVRRPGALTGYLGLNRLSEHRT